MAGNQYIISESQLMKALIKVIQHDLDLDHFCRLAGDLLGGECDWIEEEDIKGDFTFIANESYSNAFEELNIKPVRRES